MADQKELTLEVLKKAVSGTAAAFRCVTEYQPAGGPGDKVFPPTYEGGKYATEERWIDGDKVPCVLLDSVQSQANRMELALLDAIEAGEMDLPRLVVEFNDPKLVKPLRVTSLDAPHRAADAIFRDSELKGKKFRDSELGKALDKTDVRNAAPLFGLCPTALVFGLWDSTGPRGGLGAKFQRAIVSEMIGLNAVPGVKTSSRIDPLQIMKGSATIYEKSGGGWTLDSDQALLNDKKKPKTKGKDGKPSEINLGNITPSISDGGFTISKAVQTTVLSLATLRRLRFPLNGAAASEAKTDVMARVALAAIGLAGASLARAEGADLRSRCQLFPTGAIVWELLDDPTTEPQKFTLKRDAAIALAKGAIDAVRSSGLPWEGEVNLTPSGDLLELLCRSQVLAASSGEEG